VGKDGNIQTLTSGTGSPVTSGASTERIERARVSVSPGTASVTSSSSSWLNVAYVSTGDVTVSFIGSPFSASPACVITVEGDPQVRFKAGSAPTTSGFEVQTFTGAGSAVNDNFNLICMGPK